MSKKTDKTRGDKVRERIYNILDMPLDMVKDYSRLTVIGNENILIENYKGIVEYEENIIRLSNNLSIKGSKMCIEEITNQDLLITGCIISINFE